MGAASNPSPSQAISEEGVNEQHNPDFAGNVQHINHQPPPNPPHALPPPPPPPPPPPVPPRPRMWRFPEAEFGDKGVRR